MMQSLAVYLCRYTASCTLLIVGRMESIKHGFGEIMKYLLLLLILLSCCYLSRHVLPWYLPAFLYSGAVIAAVKLTNVAKVLITAHKERQKLNG